MRQCASVKLSILILLLLKTCFLCVFAIIVRGSLPRYRIDQLVTINWKIFLYFLLFTLSTHYGMILLFNSICA